jgi:tetratricopeptide (TPR) repeat protein
MKVSARGWRGRVLLGLLLTAIFAAAGTVGWLEMAFRRADRYARSGLWPETRLELARYLRLHPRSDAAHVSFAEACVRDEELSRTEGIAWATAHLERVSDQSPLAAMARSQQGRLELLLRLRPYRAERFFRHAIAVNPRAIDPYFMLWKLGDLTGRSHLYEAEFWHVYEASTPAERGGRLREWFMSQFFPATANPELDGVIGSFDAERNAARTEARRYIQFRDAEPDGPYGYAALGRWFEQEGDPKFALAMLEKGEREAPESQRDPLFQASLVNALLAVGELERAAAVVDRWPAPRDGYEYWLSVGQIRHEHLQDLEGALAAYGRALAFWPGPADWRTLNRQAACLNRLRRAEEAARLRERIAKVEQLTSDAKLRSLRAALGSIEHPSRAAELADFYRELCRPRETRAWEDHVAWLRER